MGDDGRKMDLCSILLIKDDATVDMDIYQGLEEAPPCVAAAPWLLGGMQAVDELLHVETTCRRLVQAIGVGSMW